MIRQNNELEFKIYREKINIKSNIVKLIDNDEVAYIRIRNFSHNVGDQVKKSYKKLKKPSLKGIIIGLFTIDEYNDYIQNSSNLNKRMMNLLIERLKSQVQVIEVK
jgi:hypothetical protein